MYTYVHTPDGLEGPFSDRDEAAEHQMELLKNGDDGEPVTSPGEAEQYYPVREWEITEDSDSYTYLKHIDGVTLFLERSDRHGIHAGAYNSDSFVIPGTSETFRREARALGYLFSLAMRIEDLTESMTMNGTSVTAVCPECKTEEQTDQSHILCVNCGEEYNVTEGNFT